MHSNTFAKRPEKYFKLLPFYSNDEYKECHAKSKKQLTLRKKRLVSSYGRKRATDSSTLLTKKCSASQEDVLSDEVANLKM